MELLARNFYWGGACYLLEAHDTLGPSSRTTRTIQSLMDLRCVRAIQTFYEYFDYWVGKLWPL